MNLRCKNIVLTGGETLLCHEFAEIYKYLYQQGFLITINTNGSIVSSIIKETLIEYPPYRIEITLYGKDKVSYFHFTKSSLFNKVVENIKFFKKK